MLSDTQRGVVANLTGRSGLGRCWGQVHRVTNLPFGHRAPLSCFSEQDLSGPVDPAHAVAHQHRWKSGIPMKRLSVLQVGRCVLPCRLAFIDTTDISRRTFVPGSRLLLLPRTTAMLTLTLQRALLQYRSRSSKLNSDLQESGLTALFIAASLPHESDLGRCTAPDPSAPASVNPPPCVSLSVLS
jgi:hypothetical protein